MTEIVSTKIKTIDELAPLVQELKQEGLKIVLCHGVFDLLHLGHIRHLNSAKKHGDVLIVTTNTDKHVKRGPGRPIFDQRLRAETLANLSATDFVCVIDHPTAVEVIEAIKPDYYAKGPDYANRDKDVTQKIYDEEAAIKSVGGEIVITEDITFSSSQLLNLHIDPFPEETQTYLKQIANRYPVEHIREKLSQIRDMKILVIGDTIIDQYHYCSPLGKSAKENIVANRYTSEEDYAGGTLATANHAAQLCDNVDLVTVLGERHSYEDFIRNKLDSHIKPIFFSRPGCVTTVKRRFVSDEGNRKLFEICHLDDHPLSENEERGIVRYLNNNLNKYDLVIVSDFGHGMLTDDIISILCSKAKCLAVNVQTNSANIGYNLVTKYGHADFVCIDQQELRLANHDKFGKLPDLITRTSRKLAAQQIIATRGQYGSLSYNPQDGHHEAPALAFHGIDKVGAGDAFYAYTAPCFAAGIPQDLISFLGNAVGALKIQIVGNKEPVKLVDLLKFTTRLLKV